jgi:DNA uptake protein ComE-like DNA-binding protein
MSIVVSRAKSPQNVRVAARSRIFSARPQGESPAPEDWLPSSLEGASSGGSTGVEVVREAEAVPADPAAAAELGAEVQRLRRELRDAEKLTKSERSRAERAEQEVAKLRERAESMKRAAAQAAAVANPEGAREDSAGRVDLNSASFEQLRAIGLSVTQAARLIGQREQHGGFASADDVDGIVGIPRDVKQTLKDHGSV